MPHDPKSVKLRAGAATSKNVKLYPWIAAGSLSITSLEQGLGSESIIVDKELVVLESSSGADVVAKALVIAKTIGDAGTGSESIVITRTRVETKQPETELDFFIGKLQDVKQVRAILRAYATIIDESRISIAGDLDRLINAYLYPVGEVNNLRGLEMTEEHPLIPRLTTDQKTPKGYKQGHKSYIVKLLTLGRHTILDDLLDEDGDSPSFECLDIRCLDKLGRRANIFIENGSVVSADPVIRDHQDVIYCYTIRCGKFGLRPNIGVLRMTIKPVSAPLTVNLTHPLVQELSSGLEAIGDVEELDHSLLNAVYVSDGSAYRGELIIESDFEATLI